MKVTNKFSVTCHSFRDFTFFVTGGMRAASLASFARLIAGQLAPSSVTSPAYRQTSLSRQP